MPASGENDAQPESIREVISASHAGLRPLPDVEVCRTGEFGFMPRPYSPDFGAGAGSRC
jgi:hypothetical protein